jgi:hypothetical protein
MTLDKILGKKIISIRGIGILKNLIEKKYVTPVYILFDDNKTLIELEERDREYHDCSMSARIINVRVDERFWKMIHDDLNNYPVANTDI